MKQKQVIETTIIQKEFIPGPPKRSYSLITLAYPGFSYDPGQFVMIQNQNEGFQWSYPYMIYSSNDNSVTVLAHERSSLYKREEGNKEAIWGANGSGLCGKVPTLLLAEPATFFLIAPLLNMYPQCRMLLIGNPGSVPARLCTSQTFFTTDQSQILAEIEKSDCVCAALNLDTSAPLLSSADSSLKEKILYFANTQIGCGIGACKACYLHDPDIQVGIPVCCKGPFLPYSSIDFNIDRNCFVTFL